MTEHGLVLIGGDGLYERGRYPFLRPSHGEVLTAQAVERYQCSWRPLVGPEGPAIRLRIGPALSRAHHCESDMRARCRRRLERPALVLDQSVRLQGGAILTPAIPGDECGGRFDDSCFYKLAESNARPWGLRRGRQGWLRHFLPRSAVSESSAESYRGRNR